jgi:predicted nucleic acid-binding protein
MTIVLDSGGVSSLAVDRPRVTALRQAGLWPPVVPVAVLVESLTGNNRRDFHVNRLLSGCLIEAVDEEVSRHAALLRTKTGRAGKISAVDAIVVAMASTVSEPLVITSDPRDISDLSDQLETSITVSKV